LTYAVQVDEILDESWINEDGTPDAIWAKDLEGRVDDWSQPVGNRNQKVY
jgi:hypothetical protein